MRSLRKALCVIFCFGLFLAGKATHNRAGELFYTRIAPFTKVVGGVSVQVYTYSITLIKYTDHGNSIADRCRDTIYFGDSQFGVAPRVNGPANMSFCQQCSMIPGETVAPTCGELIVNEINYKVKKNVYTIIHTYPGPGEYTITMQDPNRNQGVKNITNSINQAFALEALLIIRSFTGSNTSPVLTFPPIDKACKGECFEHNPGAYDPDGKDSLSFEITSSRGKGGKEVTGYSFPSTGPGGSYGINPITGQLSWCTPQEQGEYNLAFIVKEWRKNTNGKYELIGYILRDMQVIVGPCNSNNKPKIQMPADICVEAGTFIQKKIMVTDPNDGDFITVSAEGAPFELDPPKATVSNTAGVVTATGGLAVNFDWQTSCSHAQQLAYNVVFKAEDNGNPKLATFNNFFIRVIPPAVKNVTAVPFGTAMNISWSPSTCNPDNNPLIYYKVFRKENCSPVNIDCDTKIENISGISLVGRTPNGQTNSIIDNNGGAGLIVGKSYGYIVMAVYSDSLKSLSSTQVCASLKRNVPVILNVDVLTTSENGSIKIRWTKPLTSSGNLDTNQLKGPYQYNLKHKNGNIFETIFNTTKTVFSHLDTVYTHNNINTTVGPHEYYLEFIAGTTTVGVSHNATSVFLTTEPTDRRIDLKWDSKTPWNNYKYSVWRKDPQATTFTLMANVSTTSYSDEQNVKNGQTYCYYVVSHGEYSDTNIFRPLLNASQISCAKAVDKIPPVTPTLNLEADCISGYVKVTWEGVENLKGSDDVTEYSLYYKPTIDGEYTPLVAIKRGEPLIYTYDGAELISGCYAVESKDTTGNKSGLSPDFCVDNCPIFELPNVFTPNQDGINDFFKAVRVRQIKSIDISVYDRWGNLIYKSKDPYFKWDGVSIISKQPVSEGALFYVCDVFEPRLKGIIKRTLKGTVEVVR